MPKPMTRRLAPIWILLPLDEGDQQRERKDHHENCQQMAGR
jgi:hypothetical protein